MEKLRLFLKGESISELTECNFSNMIIDKIESSIPVYIGIHTIKHADEAAVDLENLAISKLVGVRRVLQDTRAIKPKVVIEVELSSNDYIRLIKALGNGYSLTGYSSELGMIISNLSQNDVAYLDYNQSSNSAIKNMENNATQKQNKTGESKLKHTGYNNKGFVLSKEKCNLKIIVDKQSLEPIIGASKGDDTSLKFDVLITGKNKRARPLRIVLDSQHAYYQGVSIGIYNVMDGYLNGYIDIVLDNNDNTDLLFTAIQMRCEVNPHNCDSRHIPFDILNNRILFKDLNGNMALFKSIKISIVSKEKNKPTKMLKGYKKDELHAICSEDHKDANKETEKHSGYTEIRPTVIKRIPYGKGIESYRSLLKGFVTFPENYEFTFNHKIDKEVTGLIKDVEFDKDVNTTFLEVSFANDTIASKATKLFIEGKMEENTYYILPVLRSNTPSDIRIKLKSKVAKLADNTRLKLAESAQASLDEYLERSFLASNTRKKMIETIISSFSHIENNDSAFNLKRHILTTLRKDPRLSPLTRVSLNKAIVELQSSNIQENIPGKIELKVAVSKLFRFNQATKLNSDNRGDFIVYIEVMDAAFKCPIIDLSICENTDGNIEKIMTTVSVSAKARKAIEMYGLSFKDKPGVVIGRLVERSTGNYVSHVSIPSQEDLLYYKRHKSLKDFDGDNINYIIHESNLRNPVLPEDLNPENKTFKHVSEITDEYLSRLLNVSISRGITKSGLQSIITTIPVAKFSKREYLDSFVKKYSSRHKFGTMFSNKKEAGLSYRNNKDFEMYIIDDEEGYPQLDIEQENDIFTAYLRVYIPISLLIKLGAKTFKELYNKVTDDCELDVDFNVETKSADPEPIPAQAKDSELNYKSILYPEVKFERLKDAMKYANAINKEIEAAENALKSNRKIYNLPMLTNDNFKDFKAYIEKATISDYDRLGGKTVYSVVLCILVPNEVIEKLKEDNISLEDIIQHALENIEICRKGKLKNITISTSVIPKMTSRSFNRINEYLKQSQSIWRKKDGNAVKTYRVLYTYVKNAKIKALAIEKE